MEIFFVLLVIFVFIVILAKKDTDNKRNDSTYSSVDYSKNSSSNDSSYSSYRIGDDYSSDEIKVVGGFYRSNEAKSFLKSVLSVGDHVFFIPEPNNAYDKNAVMVISSNGLHIGYIPRCEASEIKRRLILEPIYGWVSESADRCYEFLIQVDSVTDMDDYNKAMVLFNNRKKQEQDRANYLQKITQLNFYEGLHDARQKYFQGLYDEAERILKPFFENGIQENTCYVIQISIYHIRKDYESEEKLIDEFFEYKGIRDDERLSLKHRKYHILRQMGVIVDNAQIEAEKVGVETTVLELDGFAIVEDMVSDIIDPNRIDFRDSKTLFSINLDNSRKPICKFYFNNPDKMYIGLIEDKVVKYPIKKVEDIKDYSDKIRALVTRYRLFDK